MGIFLNLSWPWVRIKVNEDHPEQETYYRNCKSVLSKGFHEGHKYKSEQLNLRTSKFYFSERQTCFQWSK